MKVQLNLHFELRHAVMGVLFVLLTLLALVRYWRETDSRRGFLRATSRAARGEDEFVRAFRRGHYREATNGSP